VGYIDTLRYEVKIKGSGMSILKDDMAIGETISLKKAMRKLAKVDGGDKSLRWTLRFCLNERIKVCIKSSCSINVWEREKEHDVGVLCDKCLDLHNEREKLHMEGIYDESKLPQPCENCHMNKEPLMGRGDYITERFGLFFLSSNTIDRFTIDGTDECAVGRLFVRDDAWKTGYKDVEVASEREVLRFFYSEELHEINTLQGEDGQGVYKRFKEEILESINEGSADSFITIGLGNLYVWKKDFEESLKVFTDQLDGDSLEDRQDVPMFQENKADNKVPIFNLRLAVLLKVFKEEGIDPLKTLEVGVADKINYFDLCVEADDDGAFNSQLGDKKLIEKSTFDNFWAEATARGHIVPKVVHLRNRQ